MKKLFAAIFAEITADPKYQALSDDAKVLSKVAYEVAWDKRSCYPNWAVVEKQSAMDQGRFFAAFEELCNSGIVFNGFPSLLVALADTFPLVPMWGPIKFSRPSPNVWRLIRAGIFKRDNYTCTYCGVRGALLECDHIVPFSKGGGHEDENLTTACKKCNRSKNSKSVEEWRGK